MTNLVPTRQTQAAMVTNLNSDLDASRHHYEMSWSISTLRAYRSDWCCWEGYCADRGVISIPAHPESIAGYLSALTNGSWGKKRALSTIERRVAAIGHIHLQSGHPDPTADPRMRRVLSGIRREQTVRRNRKDAVRTNDITKMVAALERDPRSIRDKALLLVGFATGCRRSELVALEMENFTEHKQGLVIEVARSKSDQVGEGQLKLIRMGRKEISCPVNALHCWLALSQIKNGPIFRTINNNLQIGNSPMSERAVARAVQRVAKLAGLNPSRFGGHSLRAGYVTEADARGAKTSDIMAQTGHKTSRMISIYTRYNVDEQFEISTALDLGL